MSFIQRTHTNPGAVPKRMDRWAQVLGSDLIMETIEKQLDITYAAMYKITPVRTGYLRSTEKVVRGDNSVQLVVTAYYAGYVNQRRKFFTNSIVGLSIETIVVVRNLFLGNF